MWRSFCRKTSIYQGTLEFSRSFPQVFHTLSHLFGGILKTIKIFLFPFFAVFAFISNKISTFIAFYKSAPFFRCVEFVKITLFKLLDKIIYLLDVFLLVLTVFFTVLLLVLDILAVFFSENEDLTVLFCAFFPAVR